MLVSAAIVRRLGSVSILIGLIFCGASRLAAQEPQEAQPVHAERHFGLGLIVGHPTGLSLKGYLSPDTAIDGAIGFGDNFHNIHIHADYLWHFEVQRWAASHLQLYLGVGPELELHTRPGPARENGRTDFFVGARAPFGFSLMFSAPFDVFAELAAGLWFVREPRVHVDAALGARYWF